jgi:hypothetical protein
MDLYQVVVQPPNLASLPAGPINDTVHLVTNDPEQTDIAIPVTGSKD